MRTLRLLSSLSLLLGAGGLVACGGGGGGGAGSTPTATVAGQVILRDGATQNLGGIQVSLAGVGLSTTTAADGTFSFGMCPAGNLAVTVHDPLAPLAGRVATQRGGDDDADDDTSGPGSGDDDSDDDSGDDSGDDSNGGSGGRDDDDGDDHDVGDDDFDVDSVDDSDDVRIELEVRGGKVDAIEIRHARARRAEARVALVRAETSDDGDAAGSARLEARTDRQKLKVEAEHLDAGRALEAFVLLDGVAASIGTRTVGAFGEAEWEIATNDGGVLPHGAVTVAELAGASVEVRDATSGLVLLTGTLPELATPPATPGTEGARSRGRASLTRTAAAGAGTGYVEVRRRVESGLRNKFKVEAEHFAAGTVLEVWLSDGSALVKIATMTVGSLGEAELELESQDGDPMPFGVGDVAELVGRAVEVRRTDGTVLLSGTVPTLVSEG